MVFVQNSNENTTKVILSSSMKTRGTANNPAFDFQTPLVIPQGSVGLVNVEGFFGMTPSLFHSDYMNHSSNVFLKSDGTNMWTTTMMKSTFLRCTTENMGNPKNIAYFLFDFLATFDDGDLFIEFPVLSYTLDDAGKLTTSPKLYSSETDGYSLSVLSNGSDSLATRIEKLSQYISRLSPVTFKLRLPITHVHSYTLKGAWLQCLGLRPDTTYTFSRMNSISFELQTEGVQFINLNCGLGRNVMSTQTNDMRLTGSDILWTIPLPTSPGTRAYYTNFSSGGKIVCTTPVVETLELYFTDKYNFPVLGLADWTVILNFDYMEKEVRSQPVTSKDARRFITSY